MAPPLVTIYVTSLTSQPKVRSNIELLHRALNGLDIPYEAYDLVIDEDAKRRWQRAKPEGIVVGLPGYLVGGEWVGTMEQFEEAVETQTLEKFLKQDMDLADASQTIGEAELDRLMREMTEEDLDQLVGHLSVQEDSVEVDDEPFTISGGASKATTTSEAKESDIAEKPDATEDLKLGKSETAANSNTAEEPEVPETTKISAKAADTSADATSPTGKGGILAGIATAASSAVEAVSEAAHKMVETVGEDVKDLTTEPVSTSVARQEAEAAAKEGKPLPEADIKKDETLDDVIDKTLAKESVQDEEEKDEKHEKDLAAQVAQEKKEADEHKQEKILKEE